MLSVWAVGLGLLLAACGSDAQVRLLQPSGPPAAATSPADGSTLDALTSITVDFDRSMSPATLVLGGTLAAASDGGVWTQVTVANDRLVISPASVWLAGLYDLTLDVQSVAGDPLNTVALNYTVADTQALDAGLAFPNPTGSFAIAGGTVGLSGYIANAGNHLYNLSSIVLALPTGWSAASLTAGGVSLSCIAACNSNVAEFSDPVAMSGGQQHSLTLNLNVPASATTGLYDVGFDAVGAMQGNTVATTPFPGLERVPVGAVRSTPPVIDCGSVSTASSVVTGTSAEANGSIARVYVDGAFAGQGLTAAGQWSVALGGAPGLNASVSATIQAPGELESAESAVCPVNS